MIYSILETPNIVCEPVFSRRNCNNDYMESASSITIYRVSNRADDTMVALIGWVCKRTVAL